MKDVNAALAKTVEQPPRHISSVQITALLL
jgi:hypothetical protein